MRKVISIVIVDADKYFNYGLRLALTTYFQTRYQDVLFFDEITESNNVDIVFLSNTVTLPFWFYHLRQQKNQPFLFFIKDRKRHREIFKCREQMQCSRCSTKALYRHQTFSVLHDLLDKALSLPPQPLCCFITCVPVYRR